MARESQIQIHRTEAVGATPSGLTSGELAVNLRDQKLFVGLSSGGYLTFNSVLGTPIFDVVAGNNINVLEDTVTEIEGLNPPFTNYIVSLNSDIDITGNAIFSGYDRGVTFNGRVSIGNGNGGWGLYRNPDAYNLTPSSGVAGLVDFTKTIASSIDYANRVGGKVAELVPANAYQEGNTSVRTVLDIDSITGAGMFLAKAYSSTGQGNLIGQYLGNLGGVPPLCYKNAPGDTPQTAVCTGLERALLVENINVNFQALGLVDTQIGTPFRTLIQYGTWIDNVQSPSGLGGVPAASGSYETTFDKYVRTGYLLRGGTGTSGGATGTYVWSQWKNLVETTDDLGKYGVSTVNGGTGDISITGAGNNAAVSVRSTVAGTYRIDARIATNTGITGVASFSSASFNVGATGVVTLKNADTSFGVQGNSGGKADVTLGGNLTLTGSSSIRTVATSDGFLGVDVVFDNRIATTSLTGVASFPSSFFTVSTTGAVNLAAAYQVTGHTVVSGGASQLVGTVGNTKTIDNRVATAGATGVASFPSSFFTVSTTGAVNLATAYQVTGNTVVSGGASQLVNVVGNIANVDNRVATTTGLTGVASFDSGSFAVSLTGHTTIKSGGISNAQLASSSITVSSGSGISVSGSPVSLGGTVTVNNTGVTGIAFGTLNTTAMVGQVSLTAGSNITITRGGIGTQLITISSSGATGDTVVAGNGISVSKNNNVATITNMGVTGIGFGNDTGLTGKINLTGSAITVDGNTITFTSGSGGVPSVNGDATAITITGAGNDAAVVVRRTGSGIHAIDARIAGASVTGVASFDSSHFTVTNGKVVGSFSGGVTFTGIPVFSSGLSATGITANSVFTNRFAATNASFAGGVTFTGTPVFSSGLSATGITANSVFTNRFTATNASFSSGVTFSGTVSGAVKSFNGNDGIVTITGAGQGLGQAIKVTSNVAGTHLIDARLASYSLTGVAYFDTDEFIVDADGYVHIRYPNNGACVDCSIHANAGGQQACLDCGCNWTSQCSPPPSNTCFYTCTPVLSIVDGSGFGITGVSGSSGASLYFDPANLTAYTGEYDSKKLNYVLIYDNDEPGLVKAKRASIQNFFAENFGLIKSSTSGQLTDASKKTFGDNLSLEIGVVLGNVAAGQEGLVKGASAFAYIETNTVRSFNGLTGAVTAVASLNGCTAAVVITGSASEIEVLNTCPNIVIGLPDNVTISNLNVLSGATFGGNISAKNVVTSVNGATGAITNVAKTNVSNDFTSSQQFSDLTVTGFSSGSTVILNSPTIEMGDVYQVGDSVRLIIDNGAVGIYAYGSINQYGAGGIASDSTLYAPNVNATQFFTFPNGQTATSIITTVNGATGAVTITGDSGSVIGIQNNKITARIATASVTGVASFDPRHFALGASGHVSLTGSYQVTGNTVVSGGASQLVSVSGNIATIDNRIATASVTGVASFGNEFVVTLGAVGLTSNYVKSFNGLTGAVFADAVTWSVITADQTAVINRGYFANKGTLLTLTLPTTAAVGSVIRVSGMNAGLWRIAQNASEVIHFGKTDTTVGTSGYLESTLARDSVELICCVTDNEWNVVSSIGNITIA
jgi:hypothetical protein